MYSVWDLQGDLSDQCGAGEVTFGIKKLECWSSGVNEMNVEHPTSNIERRMKRKR
jgi:hypothetical protein